MSSAKTPLEKAILLEAVEWVKLKLTDKDERMRTCRNEILISQSLQQVGKLPKPWETLQPVLHSYQSYLKTQIEQGENSEALRQEHDACLILLTALKTQQTVGKSWQKKIFFKNLTEQQVYQQTGQALFDRSLSFVSTFKKNHLKKLWAFIYDTAQVRLPLTMLEDTKKTIETERQQQKSRYQALVNVWQTNLSVPSPQSRWKQAYLYNQIQPVHQFGGHNGVTIHSFFHLSRPFESKRFDLYEALQENISGLLGSTYFGQEKSLTAENTLCLDANYQQGHVGATANGYGHFSTLTENRKVHQAAYRTVKLMTRYAALYPDAGSPLCQDSCRL